MRDRCLRFYMYTHHFEQCLFLHTFFSDFSITSAYLILSSVNHLSINFHIEYNSLSSLLLSPSLTIINYEREKKTTTNIIICWWYLNGEWVLLQILQQIKRIADRKMKLDDIWFVFNSSKRILFLNYIAALNPFDHILNEERTIKTLRFICRCRDKLEWYNNSFVRLSFHILLGW